ncbi:hypothetical protein [Halorarum salinum]|uniref:Uncharacterized protein n=1 Tax=Halorarum salinum TaxID=2743089 RepID=A0A7D5LCN9_9EURY|nr:hypothetical protein [Halobaculum salinum]QLG62849.1 hypothetical protein HUG12_14375 [Halobaculum salinum]
MTLGFECPNCGDLTSFSEDADPEDIKNNIYECGGCGENILMDSYDPDRGSVE